MQNRQSATKSLSQAKKALIINKNKIEREEKIRQIQNQMSTSNMLALTNSGNKSYMKKNNYILMAISK